MTDSQHPGPTGPLPTLKSLVTDPQFLSLWVILGLSAGALYFFGFQLVPFLTAFIIAYFLEGGVVFLTRRGMGRLLAVVIVFNAYLGAYIGLIVGPMPLVAHRAVIMAGNFPGSTDQILERFPDLPDPTFGLLPENFRRDLINGILEFIQQGLGALISGSMGVISEVTAWAMFIILVPLLVFFFMKDREALSSGVMRVLPRDHELATRIWSEMEVRMGRYVRGKILEIFIVGGVSWAVFWMLGFEYPLVFGMLSGLSVLVPYVGMVALAVPLFIQGYLQWGFSGPFWWLIIVFSIIHFLDGNVLVPVMLSRAVNLHPVSVLLAVVLFGSVWGFWGVLFSIPLATFAKILFDTVLEHRADLRGKSG